MLRCQKHVQTHVSGQLVLLPALGEAAEVLAWVSLKPWRLFGAHFQPCTLNGSGGGHFRPGARKSSQSTDRNRRQRLGVL